jgi:uncharacterized membrane protein
MTLYLILKWLHVLLAIAAVGTNMTYAIWINRAAADGAVLPFTLRGVKILDDRVANPSYGLLLVTGLLMAYLGGWSLATPWMLLALVLYVVVVLVGLFGYTPTLREQIRLADVAGPSSADYQTVAKRSTFLGIALAVVVVAITFLMVVKPALWAAS